MGGELGEKFTGFFEGLHRQRKVQQHMVTVKKLGPHSTNTGTDKVLPDRKSNRPP